MPSAGGLEPDQGWSGRWGVLVKLPAVHPTDLYVVRHHAQSPGPPVVLVHGAPDRSRNYARVVHQLSDLSVTVYDRRGYGQSLAAGAGGGGFDVHADDLIALLDGNPSVVVGQSAGGAIALAAAARAPELFLSLAMWEPPMTPWDWWPPSMRQQAAAWAQAEDTEALAEQFNRGILGDVRFEQLSDRTRSMLRAEGAAFRADMASQDRPFADLDRLTMPRIVGCGTVMPTDPTFVDLHRHTAERTGSELLVVEGADHSAHLSRPEAWVRLVRAAVELAGSTATST